jgi:integrase
MGRRATKRSFGSIRKLRSGRYQARYTAPTGETVSAPSTFSARIDAEAWLAAERKRMEEPDTWRAPKVRLEEVRRREEAAKRPPLREYAEQWIQNRRNSRGQPLRPLTRDKYRSSLQVHVYPTFGDVPLDAITRADIRAWYDGLDAGPTARAHAYATLRAILNTAVVDDELLTRNPAYVRGGGARGGRKHLQPASLAELTMMVEAMPERRRLLLLLATWCALRSGELRELRRSDIALGREDDGTPFGWVNVTRGVVRARTGEDQRGRRTAVVVGAPKTDAGVRVVSIPSFLLPAVREHLLQHAAPGKDGLLFPSDRNAAAHLSEATLNGRAAQLDPQGNVVRKGFGWREARRRAGRADLDLHDLRHTGASMAGEEGASMAELMYRLGHSTPAMAMQYQHSRLERDRDLGRRLSARAEAIQSEV